MTDSGVTDRWHRTRSTDGAPLCSEHRLVPTARHGRGKRWLARYRDDDGKHRSPGFDRKIDAAEHIARIRAGLAAERARRRENARWVAREHQIEASFAGLEPMNFSIGFDPRGYFVYVLWGSDPGRPIYIGKSTNVLGRLGTHLSDRVKRDQVHRVTLLRCNSEREMTKTEESLISRYRPSLNTHMIHSPSRHVTTPGATPEPGQRQRAPKVLKGICPACYKKTKLQTDGTIACHTGTSSKYCPGWTQPPEQAPNC